MHRALFLLMLLAGCGRSGLGLLSEREGTDPSDDQPVTLCVRDADCTTSAACHVAVCSGGQCSSRVAATQTPCDDGIAETANDTCDASGTCVGQAATLFVVLTGPTSAIQPTGLGVDSGGVARVAGNLVGPSGETVTFGSASLTTGPGAYETWAMEIAPTGDQNRTSLIAMLRNSNTAIANDGTYTACSDVTGTYATATEMFTSPNGKRSPALVRGIDLAGSPTARLYPNTSNNGTFGDAYCTGVASAGAGVAMSGIYNASVDLGAGNLAQSTLNASFVGLFDSATLALVWARALSPGSNNVFAQRAAIDQERRTYFAASFSGTFTPGPSLQSNGSLDVALLSFDAGGTLVYAKSIGSSAFDEVARIAIDPANALYVCGSHRASIQSGGGITVPENTFSGTVGTFVAKLAADGSLAWLRTVVGDDSVSCGGIDLAPDGTVMATGDFRGTIDFFGDMRTAPSDDGFLLKLTPDGDFISVGQIRADSTVQLTHASVDPLTRNLWLTGTCVGTFRLNDGVERSCGPTSTNTFITRVAPVLLF